MHLRVIAIPVGLSTLGMVFIFHGSGFSSFINALLSALRREIGIRVVTNLSQNLVLRAHTHTHHSNSYTCSHSKDEKPNSRHNVLSSSKHIGNA